MSMLSLLSSPSFLRRVLWADAITGLGCAALHLAFTDALVLWLGLPAALLIESGLVVVLFVLLAGALALQRTPSRAGLMLLVAGNLAWVAGCVWLLVAGPIHPTPLGQAWLAVQAVTVLLLADLQWWSGLRRGHGSVVVA